MNLRPYQTHLIHSIYREWTTHRAVCAQLPTGGGKTVVFSKIAADAVAKGHRALILAHREELIVQAADKLGKVTGLNPGIIKSGYPANYDRLIQVASVQSLVNRLDAIVPPRLIITDEAHHATAGTYQEIYNALPDAFHLGLTATPIRTDGQGLDDVFDTLVCGPTTAELMEAGHLSRYKLFADANPMTTKGVRSRGGDYSVSQLERENPVTELSGNLVDAYRQHASGKRCIVFAPSVSYSEAIAQRYRVAGIPAMHLDGNTPDEIRREALAKFTAGELLVLSNVGLFTEGTDVPALDAVQIARPTKSLGLWLQMIGRALRIAEGKNHAVVLDHTNGWIVCGLPDDEFLWSLQGVQKQQRKTKVNPKTREVEEYQEEREIVETSAQLVEVGDRERDQYWRAELQKLIDFAQEKGYKPAWIMYQLKKQNAPYPLWRVYGQWRGYKPGWAWHQAQQAA